MEAMETSSLLLQLYFLPGILYLHQGLDINERGCVSVFRSDKHKSEALQNSQLT